MPGFALDRVLGSGGFATVYLARALDPPGQAEVAVKVAHQRGDPRMAREAEALRRLGAPTVPGLVAEGATADGRSFLAMEHLGSDSLANRLAHAAGSHEGCLDRDAASQALSAVCEAVDRMHAAGLVHRDLKPENILFRPGGGATLIDLGLAQLPQGSRPRDDSAPRLTHSDERLGTDHYMAPEQCLGAAVDRRADIYALGIIAFEMLTGRPPFVGASVRHGHVAGRCPRPGDIAPLPRAVDEVLLRCLAKDPEQRFGRATELAAALARACREERPQPQRRAPAPTSEPRAVALLGLCTAEPAPRVAAFARAHDAEVAMARGGRYTLAFPWAGSAGQGVRAALAAARAADAPRSQGPRVVHVGRLRVRHTSRGLRLIGSDLDAPALWPASAGGEPVLLSDRAARCLEPGATAPAQGAHRRPVSRFLPGFADVDARRIPLRGRDAVLDELAAEAAACVAAGTPVLSTIEAGSGLGKTRLLHALAVSARSHARAHVAYVRAASPGTGREDLAGRLLRLILEVPEPCSLAALDAAWSRLGAAPPQPSRWAAALLAGAATRSAPELAPVLRTPGALRHAAARALALALRSAAQTRPVFLLIDDAHAADLIALDALELATMGDNAAPGRDPRDHDAPCALGVWVTARPELHALRPRWGDRAAGGRRRALAPLERDAARALLLELLCPAEFVAEAVLERLCELAGGVPLYLVELARAVRHSGAIRRHRDGIAGYYVAADELLAAVDMPVDERLARQALDQVPEPLLPLAHVAAVLGHDITAGEVRAVQSALQDTPAAVDVDAAVGLQRLLGLGLLQHGQRGLAMRHPLLGRGIEALIPARRRRTIHAAIARSWQAAGRDSSERLAHHAARGGDAEAAARIYLALAGAARDDHRYTEAERCYGLALEYMMDRDDGGVLERYQALAGRGRMRYRLQRHGDALDDLERARALAEDRGDLLAGIELLLDQATVLDFRYQWARSADITAMAERAAERVELPASLRAALDLARGRVLYRQEQPAQALELLERAARDAAGQGDYEVHIAALLLAGPLLLHLDHLDRSERCFDRVLARCRSAGDDFHLAIAHINRQMLWFKRGELQRVIADLEAARTLGRQLGNAQIERASTYNLAEILYWCGDMDRALPLAERSRELFVQFMTEEVHPYDYLLEARIACSRGDARARTCLQWITERCDVDALSPSAAILLEMVRLAVAGMEAGRFDAAPWRDLAERARAAASVEERIEIAIVAGEVACGAGDVEQARAWCARAREAAARSRMWEPRLAALERRAGR